MTNGKGKCIDTLEHGKLNGPKGFYISVVLWRCHDAGRRMEALIWIRAPKWVGMGGERSWTDIMEGGFTANLSEPEFLPFFAIIELRPIDLCFSTIRKLRMSSE